eukprot:scaffold6857_cov125-Isochrysis_galbana.AAC.7
MPAGGSRKLVFHTEAVLSIRLFGRDLSITAVKITTNSLEEQSQQSHNNSSTPPPSPPHRLRAPCATCVRRVSPTCIRST